MKNIYLNQEDLLKDGIYARLLLVMGEDLLLNVIIDGIGHVWDKEELEKEIEV